MVAMIRSDLDFILAQIKIAEADARGEQLLGNLIPNPELPWGLRRVDGSNNNLLEGQSGYGASDQPFPRATDPSYTTGSGFMAFGPPIIDPGTGQPLSIPGTNGGTTGVPHGYIPGPGGNWLNNTTYAPPTPNTQPGPRSIQPSDVVDSAPRTISNLLVDQTANNPAVIYKALQDAGVADPFAVMGQVSTAVDLIKAEKAQIAPLVAAVTSAQAAVTLASGPLPPALAATLAAYAIADTANATLATSAADAVAATGALSTFLNSGAPAVSPGDLLALQLAKDSVAQLIVDATAVRTALASDLNVAAADLAAANDVLSTATSLQALLNAINLTDNNVGGLDIGLSAGVAGLADDLPAAVIALNGLIEASVATLTPTALATANANLLTAQQNLTAGSGEVTAAENALRTLLTDSGITLEEAPDNNILKATLFVQNVAPDEGLSAPFNGWMTLFGQFFDHGLDLVGKGGYGTVYIPLQPDDPLYVPGSNTNFMAVTRATLGPDGQPINKVTPFVDQNQTYTSNASAQVFHREYVLRDTVIRNPAQPDETATDAFITVIAPQATGNLLNGNAASGGGIATWADIKKQALEILGIELNDFNIHSIPEIVVDAYGNFIPGANGFPQLVRSITTVGTVTTVTAVEGNPAAPVRTADGQVSTGHAFLDDIAHAANPDTGEVADANSVAGGPPAGAGFYDNELLDAHYITGDGRGNENIGLTAVHHVFHSEHNRQVELIKNLLLGEAQAAATALAGDPLNAALIADAADKLAFLNEWTDVNLTAANLGIATTTTVVWDGERLFQGAKFPTEMQYQHLVFEEFARKVQPFVNVFNDYDGQLDPAIMAEFAHTVYRFGHSMLTETVDRLDANFNSVGTGGAIGEQIGLIEAFLNPIEFANSGVNADAAAGAIARGMTRQYGNEIDEFVTEALRNNLVGLPLDLAAINIARGRETGVPSLNDARANFYAGTSDSQLKPYESWAEFAQNIKNPASIINFVAAYGTHGTILSATTAEAKRDAATAIVLGGAGAPTDRLDFLNSTGTWLKANNNASLGGLNNVDFWIGGLAEKKMVFGGMLGSTFNFVFETQMEALQDGDRFYYLSRLANLNLTAQLENNKFSEMIHRNTDATHLPGDAFARPDFFLEADQSKQFNTDLGNADPLGDNPFFAGFNPLVKRTDIDNNGTAERLEYTGAEHVVLGGTDADNILIGGLGDDALWGDGGNDRLEGGEGNDFFFGGDGADIITDKFGDDEVRSQGGDDVVNAGQGFNLIITDTGNDFVWAGVDTDEILLGQGDDFGAGGAGEDMIIGGEGNDWIETGTENGLFLGDNGDLIQGLPIKRSVDSPIVGNDILISTGGNADFDAETGDDIMIGGLGTDRFFGAFGFDWTSYKNDQYGVEADMNNLQFAAPAIASSPGVLLDRYAQTEGLSGSSKTDFLRGDNVADLKVGIPGAVTSQGQPTAGLDQALKDANLDMIEGLRAFLAPGSTPNADEGEAGVNTFSTGNILLGGQGSDVIEGRGGNDIIDGDRWLNVLIRVTPDLTDPDTWYEVQGMSDIQDELFAGTLKVANLSMIRRIEGSDSDNVAVDVDVAQFSGRRSDYLVEGLDDFTTGDAIAGGVVTAGADGFVTVRNITRDAEGNVDLGGPDPADDNVGGLDGSDKLKNIERLFFSDGTIKINGHANTIATGEVLVTSNATTGQLTASLTGAAGGNVADVDGFDATSVTFIWQTETTPGSGIWTNINRITADELSPVTGPTFTPTAAEAGQSIRVLARFKDNAGAVEHVTSDSLGGVSAANARPVYDEANAILGADLGAGPNPSVVDGAILPIGSFGILEDTATATAPFVFSLRDVWINRFTGADLATDPNDLINDTVTVATPNTMRVRERDGAGSVGVVTEVNTDPWTMPDGSPNLLKAFRFVAAANFEGTAVFEFNITDGVTELVPAEATLDIFAVNDAPIAPTNTANIGTAPAVNGGTLTFTVAQLIGNATDIDGDNLRLFRDLGEVGVDQFIQLADPTQGTLVENANGSFTFTAATGFIGTVLLNYAITDGLATVAATAGIVTANTGPVGVVPLARTATEDAFAAVNLLTGVTDPEGNALSITGVPATVATTGGLVLVSGVDFTVAAGVLQVTPAGQARFQSLGTGQTDSFIVAFNVTDGVSTVANNLTVTVTGVNDVPVATGETIVTNVALGTAFSVPDWALLANDIDPDSALTVSTRGGATGVTLGAGGLVTDTTPANGSFTYSASDGTAAPSATATVQTTLAAQNVRDEFGAANYGNNNGSSDWNGAWVESGSETTPSTPTGGRIEIVGARLNFQDNTVGGEIITRAIDLTGATSANLTFDWQEDDRDAGEDVLVQALNVVTNTWETLGTNLGSTANTTSSSSFTLSANQIGATSAIRFQTVNGWENGENFFVDNVNIAFTRPTLTGGAGSQILVGDDANSTFDAGAGADVILAGGGDDIINQSSDQGRDVVDGGANATAAGDRYVLNGTAAAEAFNIYTRAAWLGIAGNTAGQIKLDTEIVITRNGTGSVSIISELDNVEEITINGTPQSNGAPASGTALGDTINVFGDFSQTSLNLNTITIKGAGRVDISSLGSDHRIVVEARGSLQLVGQLRSQDVLVLPNGVDPDTVTTSTVNGLTTISIGSTTISYTAATGATPLVLGADDPVPANTQGDSEEEIEIDIEDENLESEPEEESDSAGSGSGIGSGASTGGTTPLPHVVFAGTSTDDAVFGGAGSDDLVGADGNDTIFAKDGDDNIVGGNGDDEVFAGAGDDIVSGGAGKDFVSGDDGHDVILGGAGDDRLDGGSGNDKIWGGDGRDVILGGAGNDVIFAMSSDADDVINGGEGIDTLNYESATSHTVFDLAKGSVNGTDTGHDAVANIENVVGGRGNDTFYLNDQDNVVNGGSGNDTFVFRTATAADGDTIEGFHAGDRIALKDIFGGTAPTIVEGAFTAAGQIRLTHEADGDTLLEGNSGGDSNEDFAILIKAHYLKAGDLT